MKMERKLWYFCFSVSAIKQIVYKYKIWNHNSNTIFVFQFGGFISKVKKTLGIKSGRFIFSKQQMLYYGSIVHTLLQKTIMETAVPRLQ